MVREDFVKAVVNVGAGKSHWLERDSYAPVALEKFRAYAERIDGAALLDVGCGQGHDVAAFSALGIDCEGVEINPRYLKEGRRRFPGVRMQQGNAENLPYRDGRFSLVYCRNLIFCTNPGRSLPELVRVLRPGGIGHVSLDTRIVQLSDDALLHSESIEKLLVLLPACEILEQVYQERIDERPTPHRHEYYDVYFKKV